MFFIVLNYWFKTELFLLRSVFLFFVGLMITCRGGSSVFSRLGGRADFQKSFENFVDLFFHVDQSEFPSSPKALRRPCFGKNV